MGVYASYYALNSEQAKDFQDGIGKDSFYDLLEDFEEESESIYCDIDKAWDGLHFLLTGYNSDDNYNAQKSERDKLLYDAFFGQEYLSKEGIAFNQADILPKIVAELEKVNLAELLENANFTQFEEASLYPQIWSNDDRAVLTEYLTENFEPFLEFYRKACQQQRSVLITIM